MTSDSRAQAALRTLQRDREEVRAAFPREETPARSAFPRSATFRWITGHLNARSLASTAVTAVLFRPPLLQLLGGLWQARRSAGPRARRR